MLNFPAGMLMHPHADGEPAPMIEHGADEYDPEREMARGELRGARIFRCTSCAEEIMVQPVSDTSDAESA